MINRISAVNYKNLYNPQNNIVFKANQPAQTASDKENLKNTAAKTAIGVMAISFLAGCIAAGMGFKNSKNWAMRTALASSLLLAGVFASMPLYYHIDKFDIKKKSEQV